MPTIDPAIVQAILAIGGIGLVYIVNFVKKLLGLQDKPAVLLTAAGALAGTAVVLLIGHMFTLLGFIIYSLAVFGEMTGWYKLTAPAK